MRRGIVFLMVLLAFCKTNSSYSQNINGHWYGIGILEDVRHTYNSYMTELVIRQKGKTVTGEFLYYFKDSLVKVPVKGNFDKDSRKLTIKPFSIIYYRSPNARNSIDCEMSGHFRLVASKTGSVLQGSLMADADHRYTIPDINYRLKHSNDTADLVMINEEPLPTPANKAVTVIPPVARPVVTPSAPAAKKKPVDTPVTALTQPLELATPITPLNTEVIENFYKREKEVERVLEVNNSILRLEIYDNGEIDNDSISVFFNNTMILADGKLDLVPIKLNIRLDSSLDYNELGMLALNLGTIPPNTAVLILYDGKIRHEIFLSSDLNRSAILRIRKKK